MNELIQVSITGTEITPEMKALQELEGVIKDAQKALKRLGKSGVAYNYIDSSGKEWALCIQPDSVQLVDKAVLDAE